MSNTINTLEPQEVWSQFAALNQVPRASKKEEQVIEFIKKFGTDLGLNVIQDGVGNVIIKKAGSKGKENNSPVCLQAHLDMVHQKNNDTVFDFATQGIDMFVEGDWVKAKGTTLGADNGLGVASIMAILKSTTIAHPPIEALFTIDEETGMTGAKGLASGILTAPILLNLDTEEDDELTIGCAGGVDVTGSGSYSLEDTSQNLKGLLITIKGLSGGHSGGEIHIGKGNANKLMIRLLDELITKEKIKVASILGGSLRNAIPRECQTVIAANNEQAIQLIVENFAAVIKKEYAYTDPNIIVTITPQEAPTQIAQDEFIQHFVNTCYAIPNGIYRMDSNIAGLVQSSNNLSKLELANGNYSIQNLTRSSNETEKWELAHTINVAMRQCNAQVAFGSDYPGWLPKPDAPIVQLMVSNYKNLFGQAPKVNAVHAGLECGIIGGHYPMMDMISFGPTIHGAHSPDEKANISSMQKFWKYLLVVLSNL